MNPDSPCPCGSGQTFGDCCSPIIDGQKSAATAEALMRSRYSAYAIGATEYLLESWHPDTRPVSVELDPDQHWIRLKIISTTDDTVAFVATCKMNGKAYRMEENSRFRRIEGHWFYLDGATD